MFLEQKTRLVLTRLASHPSAGTFFHPSFLWQRLRWITRTLLLYTVLYCMYIAVSAQVSMALD